MSEANLAASSPAATSVQPQMTVDPESLISPSVVGQQNTVLVSQPQMTVDPESLISPSAAGQQGGAVSSAIESGKGEHFLGPIPADLKNVIPDILLDAHLKQAGIKDVDPQARETLRTSLFTGLQYTSLLASDPRFLEHAAHMEMDAQGLRDKLVSFGEKMLNAQEKGEKAITRLDKNRESQRGASVAGVGAGLLIGAVVAVVSFLKLDNKIAKNVQRGLAALGIGVASGGVLGGLTKQYLNSGLKKKEVEIIEFGRDLDSQRQEIDQSVQALEKDVKTEFMNVHLQRAYTKWQATHAVEHAVAKVDVSEVSPAMDAPRAAHVPESSPVGVESPRMQPDMPVAAAHQGENTPSFVEKHGAFAEKHGDRTVGGFAAAALDSKAAAESTERAL